MCTSTQQMGDVVCFLQCTLNVLTISLHSLKLSEIYFECAVYSMYIHSNVSLFFQLKLHMQPLLPPTLTWHQTCGRRLYLPNLHTRNSLTTWQRTTPVHQVYRDKNRKCTKTQDVNRINMIQISNVEIKKLSNII